MYAEELLKNLLAIIHRDGGHHTQAVGIEQSVTDAIKVIGDLRVALSGKTFSYGPESFKSGMLAAAEIAKDGYGEIGILVAVEIEAKAEEL